MGRGEHDLEAMLAALEVTRRPGSYAYVHLPQRPPQAGLAAAVIEESEGTTLVVDAAVAREHGWPIEFEAAWLTLGVHSALDSVGLTAAVATALAAEGIPCNVIAGTHHDHLLVPVADEARAIATLRAVG